MYLKVICAWCGKFLGTKSAGTAEEQRFRISHGICSECKTKVLEEAEETLNQHQQNDHSKKGDQS